MIFRFFPVCLQIYTKMSEYQKMRSTGEVIQSCHMRLEKRRQDLPVPISVFVLIDRATPEAANGLGELSFCGVDLRMRRRRPPLASSRGLGVADLRYASAFLA
ncbi:hypothetical protein POX_h09464 [Penicillium oxalicum]|uniref:hypothetical protein n=1 Tax=Penicillium oxalicum TaxID=69781 RepID=UPI0020B8EDB7|nr:hypothetical protein POX_h09464 [Penicillium oxalicum]KAI2785706.1 hypothetical protein POX_h09464 [Penicillium oxalicum]